MSETIWVEDVVDLARVYEPEVTSTVWSRALHAALAFARRDLLGHAYRGDGDPNDALVPDPARIQRLRAGDVGIFKGDAWPGREGQGCVHRSPPHVPGEPPRILLTLEALES